MTVGNDNIVFPLRRHALQDHHQDIRVGGEPVAWRRDWNNVDYNQEPSRDRDGEDAASTVSVSRRIVGRQFEGC